MKSASLALRIELHLIDRGKPLESYALSSAEGPSLKKKNETLEVAKKKTEMEKENLMA